MNTSLKTLLAAAVAAGLTLASAANAAETLKIDRSGLDFSNAADVATYEARVDKAAADFCRKSAPTTGTRMVNMKACKAEVHKAAMAQVTPAERSAMAQAKAGGGSTSVAVR